MNSSRERLTIVASHLVVITLVFILPEAMVIGYAPHPHNAIWIPYAKMAVLLATFYAEYFVLQPGRSRRFIIVASILVLTAAFTALQMIFFNSPFHATHRHPPGIDPMAIRDAVMLLLTMGLGVAMRLSERMRRIEAAQRLDEIAQLKSQLNPHFLFNSLNTVYALTEFDPAGARDAIKNLSALLRYALYEADSPTVKLRREVDFITDYVSLMRARLGSTVEVSLVIDISPAMEEAQIAPMLFVNLIENAFKHGSKGQGAFVAIRLSASADSGISLDISNTVAPALSPADGSPASDRKSGGVGIANLRRRLKLIYGDKAYLAVRQENNIFVAQLTVI